jgi:dTDP-4-amino-4,6-dideoxygalactose transaminase
VRVHGGRRGALIEHLNAHGIGHNIHYPTPIHSQPCYAGYVGSFPIADAQAGEVLSLPCDPYHTDAEVARVVAAISEFFDA